MADREEPVAPIDYVRDRGVEGKTEKSAISYVSYHVRQLQRLDLVELVDTEPVRGATKHLYSLRDGFPSLVFRDTLALDQIAALFKQQDVDASDRVLNAIREILSSTGRTSSESAGS